MNQRKNFIFDQVLFHALSTREAAWPSSQWIGLSKLRRPKLKLFPQAVPNSTPSFVKYLTGLPLARWNFKSLLLCLIGCIFSNILVECLLKAGAAECCPMLFRNILHFYLNRIDNEQTSTTTKYMYS